VPVVHMEKRNACRVLFGKPKKRVNLDYIGVDVRMIFTWILKEWDGKEGTGFTWLRIGTSCRIL